MPLTAGSRLGHFEIAEPIGKGGMGEVYRAKDSKLGRDVAIKVLPEEFSRDKERLDRFEREARLLAQLNHANIATLHGLEEHHGQRFLVMELVEGETLAERIARGPIPIDEAIPLFIQITEGLEAAHEKGIVHRDLKPGNIKIGPNGTIIILDFGLAKAFAADKELTSGSSQSPTLTKGTQLGAILGTASYMSPEQARGQPVDRRADIWAFGVCLYEALSGMRPFEGENATDVLGSVLKLEPDWNTLPSGLSGTLHKLMRRCLEKDARRRLRDIGDVRFELEESAREGEPTTVPIENRVQGSKMVGLVALLLGSLITSVIAWSLWPMSEPRPVTRMSLEVPGASPLTVAPEISPDGRYLVFAANDQLYLRALDQLEVEPIPGTEGGAGPFFSPDNRWVAFFTTTELKKVSLDGGAPLTVADVREGQVGSWGPDDRIFFEQEGNIGLFEVSANGGVPAVFTTRAEGETTHWHPHALPGGKAVLFTALDAGMDVKIVAQSMEPDERTVVLSQALAARYVSTGHLLFGRNGSVFAVPFDIERLRIIGTPVQVVENVFLGHRGGRYSVSRNGSLAYVPGRVTGVFGATNSNLVLVERSGRVQPLSVEARPYAAPRLSPDGALISVTVAAQENTDLWIVDAARSTLTRFTFDSGSEWCGIWTPDAQRVVFDSSRGGTLNLFAKSSDGTGDVERLTTGPSLHHALAISPDGTLVFEEQRVSDGTWDLVVLELDGEHETKPLLDSPFSERAAALTADGHWLVYQSDESGRDEIYVRPFPDVATGRWQISTNGGAWPVWAPDGRELFYLSENAVMAVTVETEPTFRSGPSKLLFETTAYVVDNQLSLPEMSSAW